MMIKSEELTEKKMIFDTSDYKKQWGFKYLMVSSPCDKRQNHALVGTFRPNRWFWV